MEHQISCLLDVPVIPVEVLDTILSHVPGHRDLLTFALASRLCCSLAIPRHTEYRVVYFIDGDTDIAWSHLVQRPDLAQNIREIRVSYYDDAPDEFLLGPSYHHPTSLVGAVTYMSAEDRKEDMFEALSCMTKLETVQWSWVPKRSMYLVPRLLDALKKIPTLKHLEFNHSKKLSSDFPLEKHPLWALSGLESLSLGGCTWEYMSCADIGKRCLTTWVQSLSSLQFLRIQIHVFSRISEDLSFSNLRCLDLQGDIEFEGPVIKFLERHPSIQEFSSSIKKPCTLPNNFLPNLKRLDCHPTVLLAIDTQSKSSDIEHPPSWHLEHLHIPYRSWCDSWYQEDDFIDTLCNFTFLDRNTLRALSVDVAGSASSLSRLASMFPMIEELKLSSDLFLPHRKRTQTCKFGDLLHIFPRFHNLKVIHGHSIWTDLTTDIPVDMSQLSIEEPGNTSPESPDDADFALTACTNPHKMVMEQSPDEADERVSNAEVNHRILALARRCKKLERVDSPLDTDDVIWIRRKKVDWTNVKPMARWLGIGKDRVEEGWEEIEYTIQKRSSRDPFETISESYADGI